MLVFNWFRCPNGHVGMIDKDQKEGLVSIICDSCDFHGFSFDGEILEEFLAEDSMSHLQG